MRRSARDFLPFQWASHPVNYKNIFQKKSVVMDAAPNENQLLFLK
jgi:hypothetical protein